LEKAIGELQADSSGSDTADCPSVSCCFCGGIYAGVEYTQLFTFGSELVEFEFDNGLDHDFHVHHGVHDADQGRGDLLDPRGYRAYVGTEECNGIGARVTFWEFRDEARYDEFDRDADTIEETSRRNLEMWSLDIEGTGHVDVCGYHIHGFGGIRIADRKYRLSFDEVGDPDPVTLNAAFNFQGYGVTAGAEIRRELLPCWYVFGKFRGSLVFGDTDFRTQVANIEILNDVVLDIDQRGKFKYRTVAIWETQLGAERHFDTQCGTAFFRVACEAQLWEFPPTGGFGDANVGLLGVVCGFGLTR
jgi:hypothetical protein